ncbi:degenerin mec-10-like, partial [Saccoglossus kowalevskii]|uniref:Degenerin mec-10-like n=1 Tax=Saccoglossus kowalevskii TaxID=10224 RepID=A0ABM0MF57_SACKO
MAAIREYRCFLKVVCQRFMTIYLCYTFSDISEFQDNEYGNCFTFNPSTQNRELYTTSKTGKQNGVTLILFVEQSEYLTLLSEGVGFVLSVHNPNNHPFPEDESISVVPGYETSIGISISETKRLGQPWYNCTKEDKTPYGNYPYSTSACRKECLQTFLRGKCGCENAISKNGYKKCNMLNKTQDLCHQMIRYLHNHGKLTCNCPEPCSRYSYSMTTSLAVWPSDGYSERLLHLLHVMNNKTKAIKTSTLRGNIALVQVYIDSLHIETVSQEKAYDMFDLFADIGGALGLWIGMSAVTLLE